MRGDVLLALAGDVMTGRGIDQMLPAPGSPRLQERYVVDARSYVDLAERVSGPVPRPALPTWPWGDVLDTLKDAVPHLTVMNLETSITTSPEFAPGKGIHYRMNPGNVACLAAAGVDVWALANNHVLDMGVPGLVETLETLHTAGLLSAGAGLDHDSAWAPVSAGPTDRSADGRVVVASVAHESSGVPRSWAAAPGKPGVALLPDLSPATAEALGQRVAGAARPGDLRLVSVHWGGNWGYEVPAEHRRFAHRLVDAGIDVVHGHSSHHPRPVEVYRDRLLLYGCGDLVNDYEGIEGHDGFRDELRLLYLASLDARSGALRSLTMAPFRSRRLRLEHTHQDDTAWLARTLDAVCRDLGTGINVVDGRLRLRQA